MITVTFSTNRDKREASLCIKGHAGQAKIGQDIVCASASILAYTVAQIIKAMDSHKDLEETPTISLEHGDGIVSCRAKDDYLYSEVLHTFFVVQTGYALLAHNYPQYVQIITDDKA